jgi:hypothetical protein
MKEIIDRWGGASKPEGPHPFSGHSASETNYYEAD